MKGLLLSTTKHCINWHLVRNEKEKKNEEEQYKTLVIMHMRLL